MAAAPPPPGSASQYSTLVAAAVEELRGNVAAAEAGAEQLVEAVASTRRVALYGVGREGLAVKGFAMRLFHMGLQASVVGEMTAAPVGAGDLLIASAGPGYFSTVAALSTEARRAGARVLILTSQPVAAVAALGGDVAIRVPATCLPASEGGGVEVGVEVGAATSPLLMGSSYELALQLFFDVACVLLVRRLGLAPAQVAARHTNLE